MIENAKQARALGLGFLRVKFNLPDGSSYEITGPFSKEKLLAIYKLASEEDPECTRVLKASGHYGVPK